MNAHVLSLASLYHQGCDILFFTFPHHGPRAERKDLFSGIGLFGRGLLSFTEMDVAELRGLIAVHNPLTYKPKMDGKRVLIIGGAGDRFTLRATCACCNSTGRAANCTGFPAAISFTWGAPNT
ncbi:hypothetical protein D3C85_1009150 [compost metagenome]